MTRREASRGRIKVRVTCVQKCDACCILNRGSSGGSSSDVCVLGHEIVMSASKVLKWRSTYIGFVAEWWVFSSDPSVKQLMVRPTNMQ